jgi:hypothetical protein
MAFRPKDNTMDTFTSTREVKSLSLSREGALVAVTTGGTLRFSGKPDAQTARLLAKNAPMPSGSKGAFVVATLSDGLTAVYGDTCLWQNNKPSEPLPPHLREVTALARWQGGIICIGTRRNGVWQRAQNGWHPLSNHANEPADHNAQAMLWFGNKLYTSTLDAGLCVFDGTRWSQLLAPVLSSNAPRQMLTFQNTLYLRHGDGRVDSFDGRVWAKNIFKGQLPRKQASAIATDGQRLYIGQWGGYSTLDRGQWAHRFDIPALQNTPTTALLPTPNALFIGTQGRGIIEVQGSNTIAHDERVGLTDDWIIALASNGQTLYAGTFVGGLVVHKMGTKRWELVPQTRGQNVTDIAVSAKNQVYVATRNGVWECTNTNAPKRVPTPSLETQCLCATPKKLWIGARVGIYRV